MFTVLNKMDKFQRAIRSAYISQQPISLVLGRIVNEIYPIQNKNKP